MIYQTGLKKRFKVYPIFKLFLSKNNRTELDWYSQWISLDLDILKVWIGERKMQSQVSNIKVNAALAGLSHQSPMHKVKWSYRIQDSQLTIQTFLNNIYYNAQRSVAVMEGPYRMQFKALYRSQINKPFLTTLIIKIHKFVQKVEWKLVLFQLQYIC